jgi:ABC-type transport system involved in cytochrome c biogenesis permease subunit
MTPRRLAAVALLLLATHAGAGEVFDNSTLEFLRKVDHGKLALMPTQYKGRITIFDSMARHTVSKACGTQRLDGVAPSVAMLELFFNTGDYLDKPALFVKGRSLRGIIARTLTGEDRRLFEQTHRMPPGLMINDRAAFGLFRTGRATARQCFLVATNQPFGRRFQELSDKPEHRKNVEDLYVRLTAFLADEMYRPVPLDDGEDWTPAEEILVFDVDLPDQRMPSGMILQHRLFAPMMEAVREADRLRADSREHAAAGHVVQAEELAKKAAEQDAKAEELAGMCERMLAEVNKVRARQIATPIPPDDPKAEYIALYNDFLALRDAWQARKADQVNEIVARLSGNAEAASSEKMASPFFRHLELLYNRTYHGTIIWVGYMLATVLLIVAVAAPARRIWRLVGLGVLEVSTALMVVTFCIRWMVSGRAWYLPPMMNQFEAVIGAAMLGALLAIPLEHVWKRNYFALSAAFYAMVSLLCAFFLPDEIDSVIKAQAGILNSWIMAIHVAVIIVGHALVGMTMVISVAYLIALLVKVSRGSDEPNSTSPDLSAPAGESTLAIVDRCNLIVAQLACWTVIAGTILGAYWADFAWARWWGWDRKETWALITCLIFLIVLHVRFVVPMRYRGLVTSVGCIVGCAVMLFNWIVVNFFLSGLHSYA